jgi:hypothetical protein
MAAAGHTSSAGAAGSSSYAQRFGVAACKIPRSSPGAVLDGALVIFPFWGMLAAVLTPMASLGGSHQLCPSACVAAWAFCDPFRDAAAAEASGYYNTTALVQVCSASLGPSFAARALCVGQAAGSGNIPGYCADITASYAAYDRSAAAALATPLAAMGVTGLAWLVWAVFSAAWRPLLAMCGFRRGSYAQLDGSAAADSDTARRRVSSGTDHRHRKDSELPSPGGEDRADEGGGHAGDAAPSGAGAAARRAVAPRGGCCSLAASWCGRKYSRNPGAGATALFALCGFAFAVEMSAFNGRGAHLVCPQWCLDGPAPCSLLPPGAGGDEKNARCCGATAGGVQQCTTVDDEYATYGAAWQVIVGVAAASGALWGARLLYLMARHCSKRNRVDGETGLLEGYGGSLSEGYGYGHGFSYGNGDDFEAGSGDWDGRTPGGGVAARGRHSRVGSAAAARDVERDTHAAAVSLQGRRVASHISHMPSSDEGSPAWTTAMPRSAAAAQGPALIPVPRLAADADPLLGVQVAAAAGSDSSDRPAAHRIV